MNNQIKEQEMLWRAAFSAIGRALRHQFESEHQEIPDHMRQLLAQLEGLGSPGDKDKQRNS